MFLYDFEPYTYRSPIWSELDNFQNEMNTLFSTSKGPRVQRNYPCVNAWTNEEEIKLTAELPGFNTENIQISVKGDILTLAGSRETEKIGEGEEFHRNERVGGNFSRTFNLPFRVDSAKVVADYRDGVLTVTLPRSEEDKPKKIEIKAA